MHRWLGLLLIVLAATLSGVGDVQTDVAPEVRVVALVVGVSNYQTLLDLRYARADAELMYRWLVEAVGASDADVQLLLDSAATLANIRSGLRWLGGHARPGDLAFLYFSGHGGQVRDDDGDEADGQDEGFLPWDARLRELETTCLRDDELRLFLQTLPGVSVVLIFDCGYMGADELAGPDRLVLAAASEGQCAWEAPGVGHGLFTYALLEGLDVGDEDGDGRVSLQEAFAYVRGKFREWREGWPHWRQEPEMADGVGSPVVLSRRKFRFTVEGAGGGLVGK